jgi:hypothetical protein
MIVSYATVKQQLNNAQDGGYDLSNFTPEELVNDLQAFSADFDGSDAAYDPQDEEHRADLLRACKLWKAERGFM